jgi:hypothetical protein
MRTAPFRPRPSAGLPFVPAAPREGRTGLSREEKSRYHRRLMTVIRTHGPAWLPNRLTHGDHMPGTKPPNPFASIPARRETALLLKHLKAGHSATRVGNRLSVSEVLDALVAAGLPVLLREGGWSLEVEPERE